LIIGAGAPVYLWSEALAATFKQRPFPAHKDAVAVSPAAETADRGGTTCFAHRFDGWILPIPAPLADIVTPASQLGFHGWNTKKPPFLPESGGSTFTL